MCACVTHTHVIVVLLLSNLRQCSAITQTDKIRRSKSNASNRPQTRPRARIMEHIETFPGILQLILDLKVDRKEESVQLKQNFFNALGTPLSRTGY